MIATWTGLKDMKDVRIVQSVHIRSLEDEAKSLSIPYSNYFIFEL